MVIAGGRDQNTECSLNRNWMKLTVSLNILL